MRKGTEQLKVVWVQMVPRMSLLPVSRMARIKSRFSSRFSTPFSVLMRSLDSRERIAFMPALRSTDSSVSSRLPRSAKGASRMSLIRVTPLPRHSRAAYSAVSRMVSRVCRFSTTGHQKSSSRGFRLRLGSTAPWAMVSYIWVWVLVKVGVTMLSLQSATPGLPASLLLGASSTIRPFSHTKPQSLRALSAFTISHPAITPVIAISYPSFLYTPIYLPLPRSARTAPSANTSLPRRNTRSTAPRNSQPSKML